MCSWYDCISYILIKAFYNSLSDYTNDEKIKPREWPDLGPQALSSRTEESQP